MKAGIVFYSKHHGNTKKLLDAIAAKHEVVLIDVLDDNAVDLNQFDRIGFASGIYYSKFAKQLLAYAKTYLPENKKVFFIGTCGAPRDGYFSDIREITDERKCKCLGKYLCLGFDTFGPFKLVGGIAKGHPDDKEIEDAVKYYEGLGS